MAALEFPAQQLFGERLHWRLVTQTQTPGRGMDGRQQYVFRENRTWAASYSAVDAWAGNAGPYLAFLDQINGAKTPFLVPVANAWTARYAGDPAAFWASIGMTAQEITDGFTRFSDGSTFSDGTGFALPDYSEPTVAASAPVGATRISLYGYIGRNMSIGAYFTINNFLYRVQSNADGDVRFNPPLRLAASPGDAVEVSNPKAMVRFPSDDAVAIAHEAQQWGGAYQISLVEAFDR